MNLYNPCMDGNHVTLKVEPRFQMVTLAGLIKATAKSFHRRHHHLFRELDELAQALSADFWETSLPKPLANGIVKLLYRGLSKLAQRQRRRNARHKTNHENHTFEANPQIPPHASWTDPAKIAAFEEVLKAVPRDSFEQEVVAVELQRHPAYATFHEFANNQSQCSVGEAYKRRQKTLARLVGALTPHQVDPPRRGDDVTH